jgi:branched-chain amino acid transport system substrate-binding protein
MQPMNRRTTFLRGAAAIVAGAPLALVRPSRAVAQSTPIRIGFVSTLSGAFTDAGKLQQTTVAAFQKLHGDTVAGRKVEIIWRDDGGLAPDTARRLAQELVVGQKVDFLIGLVFSPNAVAVGDVSTQAKVPTFITNASTSNLMAKFPYMARFSYSQGQLTSTIARYALKQKLASIFLVYLDYSTGVDAKTLFSNVYTAGGGSVAGETSFPISTGDFSTYVQKVKDAKPQAIFAFLSVAGRGFLKAFKDAGLDKAGVKVLATGDLVAEESLRGIGEFADGAITVMNYSHTHDSKLNRQVIAAVQAQDPSAPPFDFGACATWDAMTAAYRAIEAQKGQLDPDKTMAVVRGLAFESPRGPIVIDAQTRDIVQNMYIRRTQLRDGQWANVEIDTFAFVKDPVEK